MCFAWRDLSGLEARLCASGWRSIGGSIRYDVVMGLIGKFGQIAKVSEFWVASAKSFLGVKINSGFFQRLNRLQQPCAIAHWIVTLLVNVRSDLSVATRVILLCPNLIFIVRHLLQHREGFPASLIIKNFNLI